MAADTHNRRPLVLLLLAILAAIVLSFLLLRDDAPQTPPATPEEATAQPVDPAQIEAEPDTVVAELLPELHSLQQVDLDQPPARRNLDLQHWTTEQGTRVYFMQAEELPMLDMQLLFAAGASRDSGLPGLATMTNAMLNEGTGDMDAGSIAAGFERLGAQFSNSSHRDMALTGLRTLTATDKLDPALALFAEVIARPSFPQDAFERLRNQLLASLQFRLQRPAALASEAFWTDLYPDHPYGSLPEGQADSLQSMTPESLRQFHSQYYTAGNAVIALVGDINRERAERLAQRLADALPQGPAAPVIAEPEPIASSHRHIDFNGQQTHILVGQHGISRHDPDYAALYVGNQILGGSGFGSRLMQEIRESRGLSYSVSSRLIPMQATGPVMVSMQTRADQVDLALEVIHQSLDAFISEGPTEAELIRTKRQINGEFPLSTANNASIVAQLGMIGFYELPLNHLQLFLDQVQALTTEDIRAAFARHFDPEQRLVITVGPAMVIQETAPAEPETAEPEAETHNAPEPEL
ncbi:M16 family metallopeptidase [Halopseudomonas bauzanensis]|uniref:Insulinase family protein n=1 Tax=Halopseudomonas bauzanensis TaxID=653930 RepID=A0A1I4QKG9_9GAMM|nr:pitrilysin family protein [Halopseudomonas bauzanensis]TKA93028.1 insulinase family protein [Halopseudomonas bauzanensis]SES37745.1 zinc protease [Halopseudomonas bauzanensis]SFM40557.1 zinc protease [Halopseudomonas bauzanensis]